MQKSFSDNPPLLSKPPNVQWPTSIIEIALYTQLTVEVTTCLPLHFKPTLLPSFCTNMTIFKMALLLLKLNFLTHLSPHR